MGSGWGARSRTWRPPPPPRRGTPGSAGPGPGRARPPGPAGGGPRPWPPCAPAAAPRRGGARVCLLRVVAAAWRAAAARRRWPGGEAAASAAGGARGGAELRLRPSCWARGDARASCWPEKKRRGLCVPRALFCGLRDARLSWRHTGSAAAAYRGPRRGAGPGGRCRGRDGVERGMAGRLAPLPRGPAVRRGQKATLTHRATPWEIGAPRDTAASRPLLLAGKLR